MRLRAIILCALACISIQSRAQEEPQTGVRFAWGAAFAGEVDMSGYDQSSIGMDGYFGMSVPGIQMLGLGIGMQVPVSDSQRRIPMFFIARTSFSTRPTLCFMDVRAGISSNDVGHEQWQTGEYASLGLGFNLARGKKFSSHLILSYSYYGRKPFHLDIGEYEDPLYIRIRDLHLVTLRLGLSF